MNRADDAPLWTPPNPSITRTYALLRSINALHHLEPPLKTYADLYQWSIDHVDLFWDAVWDETGIIGEKGKGGGEGGAEGKGGGVHVVDTTKKPCDNPEWFKDAKLNWAENMLWCRDEDKVALIEARTSS